MISFLGAFLGFMSSLLPEVLRFFENKSTRNYKLSLVDLLQGHQFRTVEEHHHMMRFLAEKAEREALYKHARLTGIRWVDALAGTVRPVLTYAFFGLYAFVKMAQFTLYTGTQSSGNWSLALLNIWQEDDQVLFAAVMSFWFGQRAMGRYRKG